jgi:hypothetical protein
MNEKLLPILVCVAVSVLCAIAVIALDSVTGVPFNYAVPIAVVVSLIPYIFLLRRQRADSKNRRSIFSPADRGSEGSIESSVPQKQTPRGWHRAATIHSFVFPIGGQRSRATVASGGPRTC